VVAVELTGDSNNKKGNRGIIHKTAQRGKTFEPFCLLSRNTICVIKAKK
jgi:hypothetical protein